jgi:excisionase family DNA binding protein
MSVSNGQQDPSLKNKKQAAQYLNVSGATLERLMNAGLPYVKLTGAVRFRLEDLNEFISARLVKRTVEVRA